jgi:Zinc knuckle
MNLRQENKCFYCKAQGHRAFECPAKAQAALRAQIKVIDGEEQADGQGKANP